MELTFDQIKSAATGAVSITQEDGLIRQITADFPNVTVIDCFPFIPRDHLCFGDGILHPNAKGFDYYFKGLWKEMSAALKE